VISLPCSLSEHHLETLFFSDSTQLCCGLKTFFFVSTPPRDLVLVRLNTDVWWSQHLVLCLNTTSRPRSSQTQHRCVVVWRPCSLSQIPPRDLLLVRLNIGVCDLITLFFVWTPPRDLLLLRLNTGVLRSQDLHLCLNTTSRPHSRSSQTQHRCVVVPRPSSLSQHHLETSFLSDSTQMCGGLNTLVFAWTPPRDLVLLRLNTGVLWSHYFVLCLNTTSRPCSCQIQHRCVVVSRPSSLSQHHLETYFLSDSTQVCCGLITLFFCLNTTSRPCSSETQHRCDAISRCSSLPEHHLETLFFSDSTQVCCDLKTFFFAGTPPRDLLLVRLNTGVLWFQELVLCLKNHLETLFFSDSTQVCCGLNTLFFAWTPPRDLVLVRLSTGVLWS